MTPTFLTLDDLLASHTEQIATYGGLPGIRDAGLLESARAQAETQFGGQYLYHIVSNHSFLDGNKRVGLEAALVFLEINGQPVNATDDELVDLTLRTAQSKATKHEIAEFFRTHVSPP